MGGGNNPEPSVCENNMETRHENRDGNFRAVGTVAVVLALLAVAAISIFKGVLRDLEMRENSSHASPVATHIDSAELPEPRLQDHAVQDLQQIRTTEDRILNSYGWVDQKKGVARIPIDRAMDLLAQRGAFGRTGRGKPNHAGNSGIPPAASGLAAEVIHPGGPLDLATGNQPKEGPAK